MKYLLAIISEEDTDARPAANAVAPSPEEMQAMMEPWNEYSAALTDAGAYIAGEGLQPSATATTLKHAEGGERIVTDGPFAETKEQLGGFYLLECANLDEALDWAKKLPVREGGSVEVRPVMDYGEFYEHSAEAAQAAS